ncbi:pyridine nucleotide-disulfide oxidoreductase [Nocardioides sp. GY 10113]|uniref:NAD(P)-binding domain-containing protein n=1 Tax=Nocardioides sp. GY 10113 TaxID=2569761 RepID=UPI0010A7F217|nr:NAD(P)-binding domain-containing protein [Nocardioides sp. GY 10113]TIC88896.1 pyridine nucleotide-disulfide oxidoreductase [Nocardioides sp. GY 10113]
MAHAGARSTRRTDVVVIGGGQAGLAMSRCLTDAGVDHVVLERGQTANSWRTERWDSLRLLSPNWMTRLPGFDYAGADPDGYMTAAEVVAHLDAYRASFDAPVQPGTTVERVTRSGSAYLVDTDRGSWRARAVVIASGACSDPHRPAFADSLPDHLQQLTPNAYRNPGQVAGGGAVLVVGGSASGLQIADELARAGREVTLATGEHVRVPRTYRGMDIHWWMDTLGTLDERYDEVEDLARARRLPSLQLVGSPERRALDLNTLTSRGVSVVGRLAGVAGHRAQFSGSLANVCMLADLKQRRYLDLIDEFATAHGLDAELGAPTRPAPTAIDGTRLDADLRGFSHVIWATGYRPRYPWLDPELLDRTGRLPHDGGVHPSAGLYALGLPFLRRRKSSFLDGVGPDAVELATHLVGHLNGVAASGVGAEAQ